MMSDNFSQCGLAWGDGVLDYVIILRPRGGTKYSVFC